VSPPADHDAREGEAPANDVKASLRDVWKRFDERPVLRGVDLDAPSGAITVVMGGSGSGKSTILRILLGLESYDQGSVRLLGSEVGDLDGQAHNELMLRIGMLFQFGALFDSMTVAENVGFALRHVRRLPEAEIREAVRRNLDLVGLDDIETLFPAQLSGGMRKRVALARAIAHEPELLVVDEPTTGLDPVMARVIDDLILRLRDKLGVTVLCIMHDVIAAFVIADRIAMLHDGRIVAVGTPAEVRAHDDPVVREFLGSQKGHPRS
jgi:phospholipid/cholesterol/gamma-HCH transport system ATP-binding protein